MITTQSRLWARLLHGSRLSRWMIPVLLPLLVFAFFLSLAGVNPGEIMWRMLQRTLGNAYGFGEVLVRMAPVLMAALAAALPARARLVNVGGEGQLVMGAVATTLAALALGNALPRGINLLALALAGAVGGALWAGIAGVLRARWQLNETISTLLLNYVAPLIVAYLVHGPIIERGLVNYPQSPRLAEVARFPVWIGTRLHLGVLLPPLITLALWYLTNRTYWGFRLRVIGGNPEAARRAGLNVPRELLHAMLLGGALAGIGGMLQISGLEGRLTLATGAGLGYVGFLAAWMVNQHPIWVMGSAFLLSVVAVSGDTLQIASGLPASTLNILMAVVLMAVLAKPGRTSEER